MFPAQAGTNCYLRPSICWSYGVPRSHDGEPIFYTPTSLVDRASWGRVKGLHWVPVPKGIADDRGIRGHGMMKSLQRLKADLVLLAKCLGQIPYRRLGSTPPGIARWGLFSVRAVGQKLFNVSPLTLGTLSDTQTAADLIRMCVEASA